MSGTAPRTIGPVDITTALGNPLIIGGPFTVAGEFGLTLNLTADTALTLPTSGIIATVGGSNGQIQANDNGVLIGLPVGLTGDSTVVQTTSGGLLTPSILPIATTGAIGGIIPDGATITVNPSTGVASAIGGAATSVVVGTTTVGGGTPGQLLFNNGGTVGNLAVTGTGSAVLASSPTLVSPALGIPSGIVLTNGSGLPLATGVVGLLPAANSPAHTGDVTSTAGSLALTVGMIGGKTVSLGGALTTTGAFTLGFTTTANTSLTLPTAGTVTALGNTVTGSGSAIVLGTAPTIGTPVINGGTANNIVIGGISPAAGTFTALGSNGGITDTSTAGISTTGGLIFGANSTGGAPGTNGGILSNFSTYNYAAMSGSPVRQRDITDTITVIGTMTGTDEGFTVSRSYLGTGLADAETNGFHVFMQSAAGLTMAQVENVEVSTSFGGSHGTADGVLVLQHYTATGTVTGLSTAINIGLTNDNITVGSIAEYCGIFMPAMSGAGSIPTNYFFGLNGDANAAFETLGKVQIGGSLTNSSGIPAWLTVVGPDVSAGTKLLQMSSSGVQNVLSIEDSGAFIATGSMSWTGAFVITSTLTLGVAGTTAGTANFNTTTAAEAVSLKAPASTTGGVVTVTLPNTATTIAGLAVAQTFTALQTFGGHVAGQAGFSPTVTNATLDGAASDLAGTLTLTAANPVLTFHTPYASAPHVVVTSPSGTAFTYSVSTNGITLTGGASGNTATYSVTG